MISKCEAIQQMPSGSLSTCAINLSGIHPSSSCAVGISRFSGGLSHSSGYKNCYWHFKVAPVPLH